MVSPFGSVRPSSREAVRPKTFDILSLLPRYLPPCRRIARGELLPALRCAGCHAIRLWCRNGSSLEDVSSNPTRVFVARLLGLDVFDPLGDRLGRLRDAVVLDRGPAVVPQVVGLVVEVPGKKRVFVPMTRVTSIDAGQIICTGLVNLRRFDQRGAERLVVAEVFDRRITLRDGSGEATIEDVAMEKDRSGDWHVSQIFVRRGGPQSRLRGLRRGERLIIDWLDAYHGAADEPQAATTFLAQHDDLKAADFADALHEMSDKRRIEVAGELQDQRLADILQELPDDDQVQILSSLDRERAADVLGEMDPDDAADLLNELPEDQKE